MSYTNKEGDKSCPEANSQENQGNALSVNSKMFGAVLAISAAVSTFCGDTILKDANANAAAALTETKGANGDATAARTAPKDANGDSTAVRTDVDGRKSAVTDLSGEDKLAEKAAVDSAEMQFKAIMPTIQDTGKDFVFDVPAEINMEKAEFNAFMRPVIAKVKALAAKLKVDMSKPGADRMNIVRQFVYAIEAEVKKNPKGKEYIYSMPAENQINSGGEYSGRLANRISHLFLAEGYFFNVGFFAIMDETTGQLAPSPEIRFAPITRIKKYNVGDREGTLEAPFIELDTPVIYESRDDASAFWIPHLDAVVYFKANAEAKQKKRYEELNSYGFNPANVSFDEFERGNDRDTVYHELTHWYLSKRFPNISQVLGSKYSMTLDLKLPLPGGRYADFSGKMHPINIHELCAVGSEMYHSDAMPPSSLYSYVNMGRTLDPSSGYQLVSAVVPYQVMMTAPDSPRKIDLLEALINENSVNNMEINRLVRDTYSLDDIHRLGGEIYSLCLKQMNLGESAIIDLMKNQR